MAGMASAEERNLCETHTGGMELSRVAHDWQFFDAVGQRAGIFGREDGTLEAWIFPLKLFRDFELTFRVDGRMIPARSLPRTIITRPEATSIRYEHSAFTVCETLFVPVDKPGAIISIQVEMVEPLAKKEVQAEIEGPLTIEVTFSPDVAWMWPAGLGDAYSTWDADAKVFRFGEEEHRFFAVAGGPGIAPQAQAYSNNYSSSQTNSFVLPQVVKGKVAYTFAMAASFESQKQAQDIYESLLANGSQSQQQASEHYKRYLDSTVSLSLPDRDLQTAYDWARIATVMGVVDEPFAGKGLVAGYNLSGFNRRPGFGWFFGRDSMWTALALDAAGDFATTKSALEFLATYQRPNGKIPHEIPQTAKLTDWWNKYVYGTASADGTPLYIIGMDDYVRYSGDVAFAREKWDSLWNAYQFLRSTYAPNGLPLNKGIGHGWIEGGALLPVSTELYQAGVVVAALRSLADVAQLTGKTDVASGVTSEADAQQAKIESLFWSPANNVYGYALDAEGKLIAKPSVLGTVPMWFGILNAQRGEQFLKVLAGPDELADWGTRIISEKDSMYYPAGYHFGSVWPLFTGWASVAEYRYHRPLPAYLNLRANAQLIFDGALGRATEVLSGRFYSPLLTSSSHQIWSSAMIISPILRGMLGISVNAPNHSIAFSPHLPASWNDFSVRNVQVGKSFLNFVYHRSANDLTVKVERQGSDDVQLEFSPAFSLRTQVTEVLVDGKRTSLESGAKENGEDQHPTVSVPLSGGTTTITLRFRNDFRIEYPYTAPEQGAPSRNLKIVSETWNPTRDQLQLRIAGGGGASYDIPIYGDLAGVAAQGGTIQQREKQTVVHVSFPSGPSDVFSDQVVTLQFPRR